MAKETHLSKAEEFKQRLDELEDMGMARTKGWVSMWQTSLRYFFGDQLGNKRTHKDWDWVILNYIWPSAIQEIAKLAKHHPKILTEPWETSDVQYSEAWQGVLQWLWEKGINGRGMRLEQIAAILDGKLYGYRISKIYWEDKVEWDEQKQEWVGDVKYRLWHPANFWADGVEKIDDGNCGTVRYVTLEYAQSRWPKFKKELEEQSRSYKDLKQGGDNIRGQLSSAGTYPSVGKGGIDKGVGSSGNEVLSLILDSQNQNWDEKTKLVKISEIYFRDYKEVDEKQEEAVPPKELVNMGAITVEDGIFYDTKTQKPVSQNNWPTRTVREWKRPLYPTGRHVIRAGKTILGDEAYPYKKWPFVVVPHYLLPHMWQGTDGVQLYKDTQDMINVTVSHLANNMKQYGDPKWLIESGAIASPPGRRKGHFKIGAGAGSIIRVMKGAIKGQKLKMLEPVSPSASALQLYGLFTQEFKNILGLQDIAIGKKADKSITATETQFLAISANDRISLQSAYEDEWVKECAALMAQVCQLNYDIGRYVRIIGEDQLAGITEIVQKSKDIKFDVDIIPGASLPFDPEKRIAKFRMAYDMFMSPVPNVMMPEMLRELEIPNWQKILARYQPWQMYMQLVQLIEAVKEQKITPEQAIQLVVQKAKELLMNQMNSPEMIEARNKKKEELDRGREQIWKEGEKAGRQEEKDRQKNAKGNKSA